MNDAMLSDRDLRQRDIVPPERLARCKVTVVGVGAIGRQVALQLAALGVGWLQLVDFDTVEPVNLAAQGYLEADLGRPKVEATADLCRRIHPRIEILPLAERFSRCRQLGEALFCCVDRIEARRHIWRAATDRVRFFCDGRMSGEVLRILVACDPASREHYPTTLFAPERAYHGPCTARTTIYCANIAAGLMLAQFAKWLRRLPVEPDVQLNLLAAEWTVHSVSSAPAG